MACAEFKIALFRDKHERALRRIVTQGCAVATCSNDGASAIEENEMNVFAGMILDLVDATRREPKPAKPKIGLAQVVPLSQVRV